MDTPLVTLRDATLASVLDMGRFRATDADALNWRRPVLTHLLLDSQLDLDRTRGYAVAIADGNHMAVGRLPEPPAAPVLLKPEVLTRVSREAGATGLYGEVAVTGGGPGTYVYTARGRHGRAAETYQLPTGLDPSTFPDWRGAVADRQHQRTFWRVESGTLGGLLRDADGHRPPDTHGMRIFDASMMLHIDHNDAWLTCRTQESATSGVDWRSAAYGGTFLAEAFGAGRRDAHLRLHRRDLVQAAWLGASTPLTIVPPARPTSSPVCLSTARGVSLFVRAGFCQPELVPADRRRVEAARAWRERARDRADAGRGRSR